jgi:senataxin
LQIHALRHHLQVHLLQMVALQADPQSAHRFRSSGGYTNNSSETRQLLEEVFLSEAHMVFTTLGSAGMPALESCAESTPFEVVIMDEAAQAVEPSSVIALQHGCRKCVMVGDPRQLPATVFSPTARVTKYERSMFQRLAENNVPVHLLNTQYRMHPLISEFPSQHFYDGRLLDGENVISPTYTSACAEPFGAFRFFSLQGASEKHTTSMSYLNCAEATLSWRLFELLYRSPARRDQPTSFGVITPYAAQVTELRRVFKKGTDLAEWRLIKDCVEINTVDAFQVRYDSATQCIRNRTLPYREGRRT